MMTRLITILVLIPTLCFGQWTQLGNSINGQVAGDNCGWSTALSSDGTIVAMGAPFNDNGGGSSGQVRVFGLSDGVWSQIGANLNGETGGDQTGQSVSLSDDGSIVAIGEPFNNDLGFTSGQVRVFINSGNNWSQIGQDLFGQNAVASAGTSVDLSADGNTVAFGAPNTIVSPFPSFTGNVEVYQLQGNSWVQKGGDINGDGQIIKFGQSVSLSADGNIVAIGQTGDPSNTTTPQIGRVKVYQFANNQWAQIGSTIFGQVDRDEFGYKVSLSASGNILAISTNGSNVVVVYELDGGVWTQIGDAMFGENPGDGFGSSISLSNSGSRVAIGARRYIGGSSIGRAYVFENQGGDWTPIDNPIVGVANGDQTGFSVAISPDGSMVSVGAINNDNGGSNAGQIRVFQNSSSLPLELEYFSGIYANKAVTLNWKIENQINFSHFVVEKSLDGIVFNSLKNIKLTNAEFYNYKDIDLNRSSIFYYRLKMVDNDGTFSYSNIINIRTGESNTFSILGNPVKDNLSITGLEAGATLTLYDNVGKMILQKNIEDESFLIDVSFLSSGVYYLQYSNDRLIENRKIIKQ